MGARNSWLAVGVCCMLLWSTVLARTFVDMTGQGCFDVEDRPIVDDQVYTVYADYKPTQQPTLDHCDVSIRATQPNRRLEYLVEKLTIFDCGIEIWVFDNPTILNNPTRKLTCNDDRTLPIQARTSHDVIKFSLRKQSTQAKAFEFQIQVKTDHGPPFDFERDSSEFYEMPLEPGAIVGIVIAGVVLIVVVAGIAIYCCLKQRQANKLRRRRDEASEAKPAPSVSISGTTGVLYKPASTKKQEAQFGHGQYGPAVEGHITTKDKNSLYSDTVRSHKVNGVHSYADSKGHSRYGDPDQKGSGAQDRYDDVYKSKERHNGIHKDGHNSVRSTHKDRQQYVNPAYKRDSDEEKFERQASYRRSQKRAQYDTASDDADYSHMRRGGHASHRDSGRRSKYSSRLSDQEYSMNRANGPSLKGSVRKNGKSLNHSRSSTEWSTADSWSEYGNTRHSDSRHAQHNPHRQSGMTGSVSRSRSRSRSRGDQRLGSGRLSRAGSVGRSSSRDRQRGGWGSGQGINGSLARDQQHRHRARSASAGRSGRR